MGGKLGERRTSVAQEEIPFEEELNARSINCLRDNFKIAMFLAQIQSQQPNSVSKSLRCYVPCVALLQHHRHFLQHSRGNWDWQMSGSGSWPWLRHGRVTPPNLKRAGWSGLPQNNHHQFCQTFPV